MRIKNRYLTTGLAAAGACAAIAVAPVASAAPQCINTGPNTTQCGPTAARRSSRRHRRTTTTATGAFRSSDSVAGASVGEPGLATTEGFG